MKKILIVEDNAFVSQVYSEALCTAGFSVASVASGQSALELLKTAAPDLVVLDIDLSEISGLDVLTALRTQPATRESPVIVLTDTHSDTELAQLVRHAGVTSCLPKPGCTPVRLVDEVTRLLAARAGDVASMAAGSTEDEAITLRSRLDHDVHQIIRTNVRELGEAYAAWISTQPPFHADAMRTMARCARRTSDAAALVGQVWPAHLATALAGLLDVVLTTPARMTASVARTTGQAITLLADLLTRPFAVTNVLTHTPMILVLDDSRLSRRLVSAALDQVHLRAICVGEPSVAVALFAENRFDLALLDVGLPGTDGYEIAAQLRATEANAKTPIVFVTARRELEPWATAPANQPVDHLAKPLLLPELAVKALIYMNGTMDTGADCGEVFPAAVMAS